MRQPRPTRTDLVDGALALAMAGVAVAETVSGNHDAGPLAAFLVSDLLLTLPLAVRRRWPVPVLIWNLTVLTVIAASGASGTIGAFFGVLVPVYTVAAHRPLRTALVGLLLPVPAFAVQQWVLNGHPLEDLEFITGLIGGFWFVGRVVWSRHRMVGQLRAQADELRQARDTAARAAIAQERTRIARDMHDVVAHGVSLVVVQAEAAEALLDQPERAAASLRAIQDAGRAALADLRRIVTVLRTEDPHADVLPSRGLRDAAGLVERVRDAGLDVTLSIQGTPRPLPDGVELAAYRVLQEALTNALRHAGPTRASASLEYSDAAVVIDVRDEGPVGRRVPPGPGGHGGGHGLAGARERLALYGGELRSGPDGAGFRIRARIPLGATP